MPRFEQVFRTEQSGDTLMVVPSGSHAGYRLPQIEDETDLIVAGIKGDEIARVVVDAGETDYLSSALIGALVRIWDAVNDNNGEFALCNLSDDAMLALIVTNLDTRWPHFDSLSDALASEDETVMSWLT
jgi:anti-anti-sigma factor